MPLPPADAIARRDELLVRTRRVYQAIVVSAVAATVGLSAAFAYALPGQHSAGRNAAAGPARPGGTSQPATHPGSRHHHHHHHHHHQLRPPSQPPSPAPASSPAAPPPVTSGGS